jgi:xanthine/CO dehydrogenase XdhC/CoxF family maturation factor
VQPGQELFRLIRGGRLEWRAEVAAADLARDGAGNGAATLTGPAGERCEGKVRVVAPTVDAAPNALVYVDMPADAAAVSAGMFARGEFEPRRQARR